MITMQIREYCNIQAEGRSPYPFINAIRKSTISCGNQYCKKNIFFCRIAKKDLPELKQLAEQYHMQLTVQEIPSLLGKLKKYKFRFGIPLGILAGAGIIFYYSNTLAVIEIQGAEHVSQAVILSLLAQEGIQQGAWMTNLDIQHCEVMLRTKIPEIAWAGFHSTGNRLVLQITEETPQPLMIQERVPCNIIARYNAQITDVRIYSGQLLRIIGDGVSAGEVIVSGAVRNENAGLLHYCHALGTITGIYTQQISLSESFTDAQTTYTGKQTTQKWFRLFNLKIPLDLRKPDFSECSVQEYDMPFSFLGHKLPAGILRRITTEKHTSVTSRTEEETLLALNADMIRYEKNFLSQNIQILDCQKKYYKTETGLTCNLTYTLQGEIGMISEIFPPESETQPESDTATK